LTTPRKTQKRRRKKGNANAELYAVIFGMILGGALAALQLQEGTPRLSQVPEFLLATTSFVAMFLVTAALTERVRDGLICGVIAVISQFLAMLSFYSYSYTITVAIAVVPYQSLRILTYPAAGLIGGYVGSYTREARSTEPSTDRTRQPTNHKTHLRSI
jgi:cytochrome bd-type quinol oxidase subunit 2